jgi:transketolase
MMSLAAGMASEGYHVFVYSIGNFPTFRCAEQFLNDVDYRQLPVVVVVVVVVGGGGGLAYGALGYTHHTVQDYVLMRSFQNMLIAAPGDHGTTVVHALPHRVPAALLPTPRQVR